MSRIPYFGCTQKSNWPWKLTRCLRPRLANVEARALCHKVFQARQENFAARLCLRGFLNDGSLMEQNVTKPVERHS